jgi:hypothetical protein
MPPDAITIDRRRIPSREDLDGLLTGSKPTTDTDPIDNDGATTHPPDAAGPSLPSTPDAAPATGTGTAPPSPDRAELVARTPEQGAAVASKPKRGKGKQGAPLDLEAWGAVCQSYDTISGKVRRWDPAKGDGRLIAETMAKEGQARIVARFAQAARDPWCLDKRPDLSALCRGTTDFVRRLDAAAEQAVLDAAQIGAKRPPDASGGAGHSESRPAPQNAPQPRQSTNGATAWDDMLTTIRAMHGSPRLSLGVRGSTLSHDPAEQARRAAAIAAIGGWAKICDAGDHNRGIIRAQFVAAYERVTA